MTKRVCALLCAIAAAWGGTARADLLYVSNFNTDSVLRVNTATGAVDMTYSGAGVNGPQGLALSSDGTSLYVASSGRTGGNDTIVRFDTATGAETGSVSFSSTFTNWTGLALSSDGTTLYAVSRGPTGTTTGGAVYAISAATFSSAIPLYTSLNTPEDVKVASDGSLYISIGGANVVQQRNATVGAPVSKTFSSASLNVPSGLFVGDNGASLYVANTFGNNTVLKFDTSTGSVLNTYNLIAPTGNLTGIVGSPSGTLYVADSFNNRILTLDPTTGNSTVFNVTGATVSSPTYLAYFVGGAAPSTPEPSSLALLGTGLVAVMGVARRHRAASI